MIWPHFPLYSKRTITRYDPHSFKRNSSQTMGSQNFVRSQPVGV
jgi:hypothetical protein